jgi:Pyridoxamine 5'-phosphate oxidase
VHWSDIGREQPRLSALAQERLIQPGVVLVVTTRRDGAPRLSPVEPLVMDGDLWLSMMWQSTKALDLLRDPRILVHSVITSRDGSEGEFKIRGTARVENNADVQRRYADTAASELGWEPIPGRFHLFAVAAAAQLTALAKTRLCRMRYQARPARWLPRLNRTGSQALR